MPTIKDMKQAHQVLAEFRYTPSKPHRGYTDRRLHIDLSTNTIQEFPIEEKVKKTFVGGKGYGMWYLWHATKADTRWDDPENELVFTGGPVLGITQYPGSGKTHVVSISPQTNAPNDNNVGGYFGPFMKFSGFDLIEVQGKANEDVVIVIDGNEGIVRIETAPLEGTNTYEVADQMVEMYAKDEADRRNISVISSGQAAEHTLMGILNFSWFDVRRKMNRVKQAGRGGPGTIFRNKRIKAMVVRYQGIGPNNNDVANMELLRKAGSRINTEIQKHDDTHCRMRQVGTVNMIEALDAADVLPVRNYQFGADPNTKKINSYVWKEHFTQGLFDGCWIGCTMSCSHGVDNFELRTGPLKGQKVTVDGPEYETAGGMGSNMGIFEPWFIIESNFYADHYGLDTISLGTTLAFVMECYDRGIINKEITGGIEIGFGNTDAAMELIHQMAEGKGFGKLVGQGIRPLKKYFHETLGITDTLIDDIGMEAKGMEFSEYMTKESLAQQGGYGMANKGPQHDEAWLIFMDQVNKQIPTFEDKAEALYYFPLFRTWFSLMGLCKLPWNDSEPEDNRTKYKGIEAAKVPEHVENYCLIYEGVTGEPLTPEKLIEQSRRTYNFQRMFNLRQGFGTRAFDTIPYRAMGPVTAEEYESRQKRYDDQLREWLGIDPTTLSTVEKIQKMRQYREDQYRQLQDVVYARRGWDANGVPTPQTLKELGIDFPEVLKLVE